MINFSGRNSLLYSLGRKFFFYKCLFLFVWTNRQRPLIRLWIIGQILFSDSILVGWDGLSHSGDLGVSATETLVGAAFLLRTLLRFSSQHQSFGWKPSSVRTRWRHRFALSPSWGRFEGVLALLVGLWLCVQATLVFLDCFLILLCLGRRKPVSRRFLCFPLQTTLYGQQTTVAWCLWLILVLGCAAMTYSCNCLWLCPLPSFPFAVVCRICSLNLPVNGRIFLLNGVLPFPEPTDALSLENIAWWTCKHLRSKNIGLVVNWISSVFSPAL